MSETEPQLSNSDPSSIENPPVFRVMTLEYDVVKIPVIEFPVAKLRQGLQEVEAELLKINDIYGLHSSPDGGWISKTTREDGNSLFFVFSEKNEWCLCLPLSYRYPELESYRVLRATSTVNPKNIANNLIILSKDRETSLGHMPGIVVLSDFKHPDKQKDTEKQKDNPIQLAYCSIDEEKLIAHNHQIYKILTATRLLLNQR